MKLPITNKYNWPDYGKNKVFNPKKTFATEAQNTGDSNEKMLAKGVHVQFKGNGVRPQPRSFRCYKWPWDGLPIFSDSQLYNALRSIAADYGFTPETAITDEYPENAQGFDPTIYKRMYQVYKGLMDYFRESNPGLNKRNTGLFGSYGIDDFTQTVFKHHLYGSEDRAREALTTHVHKEMNASTGEWTSTDAPYYSSNQVDVRNVNISYYMTQGFWNIPYELLFHNERIKVGSKTYQGIDRESDWIVFATPSVQSLLMDEGGGQSGIEEAREHDLLEFPGGTMHIYNTPGMSGEYFTLGKWSTLLGRGILMWHEDSRGTDKTKLNHHSNPVGTNYWILTGGSREVYQSGVNGAPVRDTVNGMPSHIATPIDACYAGWEDALEYEGYANTLYFASYTSSLGTFIAQPGASGLHLNGFGPLNLGLMCMKHALDQKKGVGIIGIGPSGRSAHYYNGFLSQHEYEDNVTLTYAGQSVNLGRVYGRQTASAKF